MVEWLAGVGFQYWWMVGGQGHIRRGLRTLCGLAAGRRGGGVPFVYIMIERQINFNNISYNLINFLAEGFLHKIEVGLIF